MKRDTSLPRVLHGAIVWAGGPLEKPEGLLRLINSQPALRDKLISLTTPNRPNGGRPAEPGHWALAYLCYVISREPAIHRWHRRTNEQLWLDCGFAAKPTGNTTWRNFVHLEDYSEGFTKVAQDLIQRAVAASGGLVGRDGHIDSTECETNARVYHDCQPGDNCSRRDRKTPITAEPTVLARGKRQDLATQDPEQLPDIFPSGDPTQPRERFQFGDSGCWYRSADPTAGTRRYSRGGRTTRLWHGYYNQKVTDHYTGAVLATTVFSASVNEHKGYPAMLNQVIENTGRVPRSIVGDKGFSIEEVYKLNTQMGIASVFPWRQHHSEEKRDDIACTEHDLHGVPCCKHCGASTVFESFQAGQSPRLWYRCPACDHRGSISCSKSWRHLLPMWRTEETYLALRASHMHYERAHKDWRDRWLIGPDNSSIRMKRRGIACQELRAQAALLLEWLNVCQREGWLGNPRENHHTPYRRTAQRACSRLQSARDRRGLNLPKSHRLQHQRQVSRAGPSG